MALGLLFCLFMDQSTISTPDAGAPADITAPQESFGSVADEFASAFQQPTPEPEAQQSAESPATMTQPTEQAEQPEQPAETEQGDDLPDFTLEDQPTTLEKLYTAEELAQLAQTDPNAAWAYAEQANSYLQENLKTIQEIQTAAQRVGSIEALTTLSEFGEALFTPTDNSPGAIYSSLLKLQQSYPDPNNGPMSQIVKAVATYRAPEVISEMGDGLLAFLDGSHPYFQIESYQPQSDQDRYHAQKYIDTLNAQRQQLLEQIAPTAYKHFGNDFSLKDQYANVGPEGEYYGLADNTIDKEVRASLPEELRPVYDGLPPSLRAKLNYDSKETIVDNLQQRKIAADAKAQIDQIKKESAENQKKVFEQIEQQQKQAIEARVTAWETGVQEYVSNRLTTHYKLGQYPATVIQMQLKQFLQADPQAKQLYDRAKEAAGAGNTPLLARIEGDLSRKTEAAIRQYLGEWQKATGQKVRPTEIPRKQPTRTAAPLYSGVPAAMANGQNGEYGTVADEFQQAFKNLSPYVNQ